jgi:hypothetical protein
MENDINPYKLTGAKNSQIHLKPIILNFIRRPFVSMIWELWWYENGFDPDSNRSGL